MDTKLILAIIAITLALVFYTIGVFGERRAKTLKKQHVIIFWLGLLLSLIHILPAFYCRYPLFWGLSLFLKGFRKHYWEPQRLLPWKVVCRILRADLLRRLKLSSI